MTPIDIANNALAMLGEPPIDGFNPNGTLAQYLCCQHYHPTRREVLCVHPWAFATRTETLGSYATADGEHSIPHTLPFECLRIISCSDETYNINGRQLFSPSENVSITYTADEEDADKFTPGFLDLFTLLLAIRLCIALTGDTTLRREIMQKYDQKLKSIQTQN